MLELTPSFVDPALDALNPAQVFVPIATESFFSAQIG